MIHDEQFDYVIIGAGSAGCVLANRLSADGSKVLLLEAGKRDRSPVIHIPAGCVLMYSALSKIFRVGDINWAYPGEIDKSRNGFKDVWSAGKVLGGGSSINGMIWVRGNPRDYDLWAQSGCQGWSYEDILPYFKSSETNEGGVSRTRGDKGPQPVTYLRLKHILTESFIKAAVSLGYAYNPDQNGESQEGVGPCQTSQKNGLRYSSARSFLKPAMKRANLTVRTKAFVSRLEIEGAEAKGVLYQWEGRKCRATARKEVILSAGTIASPKILLLSGIGPKEDLRNHGIDVISDLPSVGRNLQEHPCAMISVGSKVSTLNTEINLLKIPLHAANFLLRRRGPATAPVGHAQLFFKTKECFKRPNIQTIMLPLAYQMDTAHEDLQLHPAPAMSLAVCQLHSKQRGQISLRSADPDVPPVIAHELLGNDEDVKELVDGCRESVRILKTAPLAPLLNEFIAPLDEPQNDQEWVSFLRSAAFRGDHPVGTCRMGEDDKAVVNSRLCVRGIGNLRVVDASIMPTLTSGNTNAVVIMIAEKASAMIIEDNAGTSG